MATLQSIAVSIGFALIKQGLSWLISSDILKNIRTNVIAMMHSDLSGAEKHEAVKSVARQVESKFTAESAKLPSALLDIAIKAAYLEISGSQTKA